MSGYFGVGRAWVRTRRIALDVGDAAGQQLVVLSSEDVILTKPRWYQLGNEVSEQPWKDVVNVMKVQGPNLDRRYLDQGARDLLVHDLLRCAWAEVAPREQGPP